jgi:hypothetical protein
LAQKCLSCLQTKENIREPSTLDDEWVEIDQPEFQNISTPEALQELENFMSGFDQYEIAQQIAQAMQDIELVPSIEDYE